MTTCSSRSGTILAVLLGLLSPAVFGQAAVPGDSGGAVPRADRDDRFLFGADYPNQPTPELVALFRETGFNFARITGGGYSWAIDMHRRNVAELEKAGVQVLLQLGSHYPSADYFKFHDSWFVDQAGQTGQEDRNAWAIGYSGQNWPQYSYASREIREPMEKDFTRYLDALQTNRNVAGVILHNEAGYFWLDQRLFDYNPLTIAQFRNWLKAQHGRIEALNTRWGTTYASFDQVDPPHELPPVTNVAAWMDWRRANVAVIHDFLQWEVAFARRVRPRLPLTTNLSGPLDHWYPFRCADNWQLSQGFDVAGIDIYPNQWFPRQFPGYTMDMTRGVAEGRPTMVLECEVYDPKKWTSIPEPELARMLRSELWSYIGHGARGILMWRFTDSGGEALTRGEFNLRLRACRDIAHLGGMLRLTDFRHAACDTAVVVDPDTLLFHGGQQKAKHADVFEDAMGLYSAVVESGNENDVLQTGQVAEGRGKAYKALVLAEAPMMDATLAARLKEFVADGGLLVAEAPFATRDRWGKELTVQPGFGLDEVFGLRINGTNTAGDMTLTTPAGRVTGNQGRADLKLMGAETIGTFTDGKPALTANRHGKGKAVLFASRVGHPFCNGWGSWASPGLKPVMGWLLADRVRNGLTVVADSTNAFVDSSWLTDRAGNGLLVLAVPSHKAQPVSPLASVRVTIPFAKPDECQGVYAFRPTRESDTNVVASIEELAVVRDAKRQTLAFAVRDLDSLPILVARNFAPLVQIDAQRQIGPDTVCGVTVTCINPSAKAVSGHLDLVLPEGLQCAEGPKAIRLEPRGRQVVSFPLTAGLTASGRLVIKPRLQCDGVADPIVGVPADVYVQ